jgi:hypothetical protein
VVAPAPMPSTAEAYLALGGVYVSRVRPEGVTQPNRDMVRSALRALNAAYALTEESLEGTPPQYSAMRAEAAYLLSRVELLAPARGRERAAIAYADEAARLGGQPEYRINACLARIKFGEIFGRTREEIEGIRALCSATTTDRSAEALLYEGMYYLNRAQYPSITNATAERELAYRAFTEGLRQGGSLETRGRLEFGQGMALGCTGFTGYGRELINRQGEGSDTGPRAYFTDYGLEVCTRPRG